MESSTMLNVLSGYGVHIRALRREDMAEHDLTLPEGTVFGDCVAIDGEDMAAGLAAVVDLAHHRLVWRDPSLTSDKFDGPEGASEFARALRAMIVMVLPTIGLPDEEQH